MFVIYNNNIFLLRLRGVRTRSPPMFLHKSFCNVKNNNNDKKTAVVNQCEIDRRVVQDLDVIVV